MELLAFVLAAAVKLTADRIRRNRRQRQRAQAASAARDLPQIKRSQSPVRRDLPAQELELFPVRYRRAG